jgi:hypothetical protein
MSEANIVLSGSSAIRMMPNTNAMSGRFTGIASGRDRTDASWAALFGPALSIGRRSRPPVAGPDDRAPAEDPAPPIDAVTNGPLPAGRDRQHTYRIVVGVVDRTRLI